jgi:excisionase family DNA binding protein
MTEKLLLTVPEVAELLGLGKSKTYALIAAGELESVCIGRARRVPRDAVERFVEKLRTEDLDDDR